MIPPDPPPPGDGARAEGELFTALRSGLSDEWFVYSRLRYLAADTAAEGEADFVVLHREEGMLVIECKGTGVHCDGKGRWTRTVHGREQPLRQSPFAQAQRQVKELVQELTRRLGDAWPEQTRLPFVHGHAVAFPLGVRDGVGLPLEVDPRIVFDAMDLHGIGDRVRAALAFWARAAPRTPDPPNPKAFKRFRHAILQPTLHIVPNLQARFEGERRTFLQLTEEQTLVVDGWLDNRRYRVHGGAGTGKTVLALETAKRLAEGGDRVLLACFNRHLAHHLAAQVEAEQETFAPGRIDARNFHALCAHAHYLLHDRGLEVPSEPEAAASFWNEDAALFLLEALERGKLERWDAIVVDEGQDFAPGWWSVLEEALRDRDAGRLLVFYDPSQNIFGRDDTVPEFPSFRLTVNFRNTKAIAAVVSDLGDPKMRPFPRCPAGEPPIVREQPSPAKLTRALSEIVEQLVARDGLRPDQIAILTPHSRKSSSLAGQRELAGIPLADSPADQAGKVLHTTIGKYKGLESDVVIMVDVDPRDPRCSTRARYVAASRARHRLYVFARGDWLADAEPDPVAPDR